MSSVTAGLDMARHSWGCWKCCRVLPECSALRETGTALLPRGILKEAGNWGQSRRDGFPRWVQVVLGVWVGAGCFSKCEIVED